MGNTLEQILHRHGDRTPLQNIYEAERTHLRHQEVERMKKLEMEESQRWGAILPSQEALHRLEQVSSIRNQNETSKDVPESVFGQLTGWGVQQMSDRGLQMRKQLQEEGFELDQIGHFDISVISTNYNRTQISAQAFLHTLLNISSGVLVPIVEVSSASRDIINAYASLPIIEKMKQQLIQKDEEIVFEDRKKDQIKYDLIDKLPFLNRENFTWMKPFDYYSCYAAHNIPFIADTEAYREEVLSHLCFRFKKYYSNQDILSLVAGKIANQVFTEFERCRNEAIPPRLVVFSGHDVSILALLYALGACNILHETWWPEYSSTLCLKLYEDLETAQWFVGAEMDHDALLLPNMNARGLVHLHTFQEDVYSRLGINPCS